MITTIMLRITAELEIDALYVIIYHMTKLIILCIYLKPRSNK